MTCCYKIIHLGIFFLILAPYFQGVQCNTQVLQTLLPGSSLEICASGTMQGNNICRVTMSIDKESLSTQLSISKVRVEESALYYCAVRDTMTETQNTAVPKAILEA
ncbi:hypothetical protein XELAEV_18010259mg [Xenopus laevis]|uniref:Immunoglobulin V-set domain-containing protein n=1 Tax=Xenopus laevis TaxID=8355 RepID=A0A974DW21_XENLA|nr:hypothetical protein XELAEV_18010259mg [Xenopus laevis]